MKILILISAIFLLCHNVVLCQDAKKIASTALPSTVALIMEDNYHQPISLGSGFIVSDGKIVTNLHVIRGASYGTVFVNGNVTKHKIQGCFAVDEKNDLAILSVPTIHGNSLQISNIKIPDIGERIYAVGNPKGLTGTISEGIVSGIRNLKGSELIQITAPISPGSSGGPVFNNSGFVIGVAVGTFIEGQNLNFAVPASYLKDLLARCNSSISLLDSYNSIEQKVQFVDISKGVSAFIDELFPSCYLTDVYIKNELPYYITDIDLLILIHDNSGKIINYFEYKFCDSNDQNLKYNGGPLYIRPSLTKKLRLSSDGLDYPQLKQGQYFEFRILNFRTREYVD